MALMLERLGCRADLAASGLEVINSLERQHYDVILMDIIMPEMTGYEATVAIRASAHPDAASIPIIAMSANAFASDIQKSLEAGMNAHLAKPIDINKLMKTLQEYRS